MRRVVVTGLGMVSPLGVGVQNNWERLIKGESGLRAITSFDVSDLPAKIAGQVPRGPTAEGLFNADDHVSSKDQRKMDEFIVLAIAAAREAVADSGWQPQTDEQREATGVMIGSGIGGLIGIGFAIVVALALPHTLAWLNMGDYPTAIAPWSVIGSFLISGLTGIFFGLYPAIMAAKMNPIEALRHE